METMEIVKTKVISINENSEILIPYDYQEPVIEKLMDFVQENENKPFATGFVVMPGGSGKTVIFAHLVKRLNHRVIIASPTLTISDQNLETIRQVNPGLKISVYYDGERDLTGDVIFITYHSLMRVLASESIPRDFARYVLFDEAHRALSPARSKIIEKLNAVCIGFTATDKFSEQKNVEKNFKNEIYRMSLKEAIEMGILLPLRGYIVETQINLRGVQLSHRNQLNEKAAEKYLNIAARNQVARDFYLKNFKGIPAVAFCISINHAVELAKYFSLSGIKAVAVHSKITKDKRREIFSEYRKGNIDVLCSCDLLIEGWNSKRVTVELNLRPTYSWVLAEQRACRVIRPFIGKEAGIIVEFQDIYSKKDQHILVHHLFGNREYTQGGYIAAPSKIMRAERQMLENNNPVYVFDNLKVSSIVREVVNLKPIISDKAFGNKELIKEILLSRADVNYNDLKVRAFMDLEFNHWLFKGKGQSLMKKHLGMLWQGSKEDYELFMYDILGVHLFNETFSLLGEDIENVAETFDPLKTSMDKEVIRRFVNLIYNDKEKRIIKLYFGFESVNGEGMELEEIGEILSLTRERVRQIKERGIRNLRRYFKEHKVGIVSI
ncbi:MAG: DEAD/DEAH box helicase family protein [Minisyncoccia bacterium]